MSTAGANAKPSFELTGSGARGGDPVAFSISGGDGSLIYVLEVGGKQVLEDSDGVVSGTFTMPDLGDSARTVTVEAEIWASDKRKKAKRKLAYLGSSLPVIDPPAAAPPPAIPPVAPPVVVPHAATSPAPIQSLKATEGTVPAQALTPRSSRQPRPSRNPRAVEPRRHVARSGEHHPRAHRGHADARRNREAESRKARFRRAARIGPLFDGIPETASRARPDDGGAFFSLNAIASRAGLLAAPSAGPDGGSAAVVVPALLGLAALALAGTALLRGRRLASRRD